MKRTAILGLALLAASTAADSWALNSGETPAVPSKAVRGPAEANANAGPAAAPMAAASRTVGSLPLSSPWPPSDLLRAERLAWLALAAGQPGAKALLQKIEAHIQRHGVGCSGAARRANLDIQLGA